MYNIYKSTYIFYQKIHFVVLWRGERETREPEEERKKRSLSNSLRFSLLTL